MAVTKEYIAGIAPQFAAAPDAQATALITVASSQVAPAVWGDLADYAIALLVLHTWTLGRNNGAGPVTSEQIGDLRVSYANPNSGDKMELTSWGSEYRRISRLVVAGPMVT